MEFALSAELRIGASALPPQGDATRQMSRWADRADALERGCERALFLADHLFPMISEQTWRDSGGDDGQGHYEGEYRAAAIREELAELRRTLLP